MRELSQVTGFGENKLNLLKGRPGFPLFENKTTLARFRRWAFQNAQPSAPCSTQPSGSEISVSTNEASYPPFR